MRISDWSADVCSSDLRVRSRFRPATHSIVYRQYHCACALKYPVLGNSRRAGALGMLSAFPFLTQCGGLAQILESIDLCLIACHVRTRSAFYTSHAPCILGTIGNFTFCSTGLSIGGT